MTQIQHSNPSNNETFEFNAENEAKFKQLKTRYPKIDSLTLPGLWLIQEQLGFVSMSAIIYLAKRLKQSPMQIYQVATFYTMYHVEKPVGKHHFQVCKTLSCQLNGAEAIVKHIEDTCNIKAGKGPSEDGKFSLEQVECLGACGYAPMLQMNNDEYYENLTVEKLQKLIDSLE